MNLKKPDVDPGDRHSRWAEPSQQEHPGPWVVVRSGSRLSTDDWTRSGLNLIDESATGSGKTFLACALALQACLQKHSALYRRVPELVSLLARAHDNGPIAHERLMRRLDKVALLVLDDWGLQASPQSLNSRNLDVTDTHEWCR